MFKIALLLTYVTVCVAQSAEENNPLNLITVPPNCPAGQEFVNGACREIWSWRNNPSAANLGVIDPWWRNVITVPTNCPPGQELINGVCRDVWRFFGPTTPLPKVLKNSDLELRGRRQTDNGVDVVEALEISSVDRNIINIPNQCPIGYKPDALGICREILI